MYIKSASFNSPYKGNLHKDYMLISCTKFNNDTNEMTKNSSTHHPITTSANFSSTVKKATMILQIKNCTYIPDTIIIQYNHVYETKVLKMNTTKHADK